VGSPISRSSTACFLLENGLFLLIFPIPQSFPLRNRVGALFPAPTAACFYEKIAYFSPIFPIPQAVFGSGIGWAPYCLLLRSLFFARKWLFFRLFSLPKTVFRLEIRRASPNFQSYSLLKAKFGRFSALLSFPDLNLSQVLGWANLVLEHSALFQAAASWATSIRPRFQPPPKFPPLLAAGLDRIGDEITAHVYTYTRALTGRDVIPTE